MRSAVTPVWATEAELCGEPMLSHWLGFQDVGALTSRHLEGICTLTGGSSTALGGAMCSFCANGSRLLSFHGVLQRICH